MSFIHQEAANKLTDALTTMLLANFLRRLGSSLGLRGSLSLSLDGLHTEAETQALLQRERQRADRTSDQLVLLVLQPQAGTEACVLTSLVCALRSRLRTTDELG